MRAGHMPRFTFKRGKQIRTCTVQGGEKAEEDACCQRDHGSEDEERNIQAELNGTGRRWLQRYDEIEGPPRYRQCGNSSERREETGFAQQLRDQLTPARSDR